MASPSSKRCLYEILGPTVNSSPGEIHSAYKKLALQRHPDKLLQSGLTHHQAPLSSKNSTSPTVFSPTANSAPGMILIAQILFSNLDMFLNSVPNIFFRFSNPAFPAFSGYSDSSNGFYKVHSYFFEKIYKSEVDCVKKLGLGLDTVQELPRMGNLLSPVKEVRVSTVVDFRWVEGKTVSETEELKEEYNERVRKMAEFVRKRDKRVIDLLRKVKIEQERRQVEELEMEMKRKDYCCELCGEKFQREKREQWRKRMQDVVEFCQSFVEEEGESEELCERCIKTTSAWDSCV